MAGMNAIYPAWGANERRKAVMAIYIQFSLLNKYILVNMYLVYYGSWIQ